MGTRRTTPTRPRRRKTNTLEFYETPPGFTRFLARHVRIGGLVYEPCVGEGAIVRALTDPALPFVERYFLTNDLDPARVANSHFDATQAEAWQLAPDWVLTNPPFSAAFEILKFGLQRAALGVILHLRVSFPEPTLDRESFLVEYPPDFMFYLPRYAFNVSPTTGKRGTDATTTAWCIWLTNFGVQNMLYGPHYPLVLGPLQLGSRDYSRHRHILVAPRSVADEGWHDAGRESEGTGVPAETPGGSTSE